MLLLTFGTSEGLFESGTFVYALVSIQKIVNLKGSRDGLPQQKVRDGRSQKFMSRYVTRSDKTSLIAA